MTCPSMQGRQCCSIQWGAWAGVGMAAADATILRTLTRQGYGALLPASGLSALHTVLRAGSILLDGNVMISSFNWPIFLKGTHFQLVLHSLLVWCTQNAEYIVCAQATAFCSSVCKAKIKGRHVLVKFTNAVACH